MGASRLRDAAPEMVSEDLSEFPLAGVATLKLRVGAVAQAAYDAAGKSGAKLPSLHSAKFLPDREPTIKTAILAEVLALRELMPPGGAPGR
jgi:hypothetical protein